MADLLARFKLVDEMSDKLGRMAESGQDMAAQFEQAGAAANGARWKRFTPPRNW